MEDRKTLATTLKNFVLDHPEVYENESQELLRIIDEYGAKGLVGLTPSEHETLRGLYTDRFFDLVR